MNKPLTHTREIVVHAGLAVQHRCDKCGVLLEAFSREENSPPPPGYEAWRCGPCGGSVMRSGASS